MLVFFLQNDDQTDELLSQINVDNLSIEVSKINLIFNLVMDKVIFMVVCTGRVYFYSIFAI